MGIRQNGGSAAYGASGAANASLSPSSILLPLALAQFVCSYAGSNMNVAINAIAQDLGTTVRGVQTVITLFTLTMAALMIPGSKLTDIWGRKFCLMLGLIVYGIGAILATLAQSSGLLLIGYSLLEGVGSALLIPPIYILITVRYTNLETRAKSFGIVSAAAGIGAAAGPLVGGLVTSAISWRASFILQVLIVAVVIVLGRRIEDPGIQGERPQFDVGGAILSAVGMFFVVFGILQSGTYGWFASRQDFAIGSTVVIPEGSVSPVWLFIAIGAVFLAWFFFYIRSRERAGKEPLISIHLFRNRVSNLGLVTQNIQWLILQGSFFVISVFLQTVRGYNAIETGLMLTPTTIGILITGSMAQRMASRHPQPILVRGGFISTIFGLLLLLFMANATSSILTYVPGLFFMGAGVGIMLTSSVNVVQSAFPEEDQGEISGLSRSVSNLGSSMGTAFVGSILAAELLPGNQDFALSLIVMVVFTCIGLAAALFLPSPRRAPSATTAPSAT